MTFSGSAALERCVPSLGPAFEHAGLTDEEARTFLDLCRSTTAYPSYDFLRAQNRALADAGHIDRLHLGYSTDHPADSPTPRPIEAAILGRRTGKGAVATHEAPQHATEVAPVATAVAQKRLHVQHPNILDRMGYDTLAVSDHADPDAMLLQSGPASLVPMLEILC